MPAQESVDDAHGGSLSGAVVAQEREYLAFLDDQRQIAERHGRTVPVHDVVQQDGRHEFVRRSGKCLRGVERVDGEYTRLVQPAEGVWVSRDGGGHRYGTPGVQLKISQHDVRDSLRAKLGDRRVGGCGEEPHGGDAGVPGEHARVDEHGPDRSAVVCGGETCEYLRGARGVGERGGPRAGDFADQRDRYDHSDDAEGCAGRPIVRKLSVKPHAREPARPRRAQYSAIGRTASGSARFRIGMNLPKE